MKTTTIYTFLILTAATLFSCRKEYSVENGNGLPADLTAQVNGVTWDATAGSRAAFIAPGGITIVGTSASGQQLDISLNDKIIGTYTLNQQTGSVATFSTVDSSSFYSYSTNQGSDTAQAGGSVIVMAIDSVGMTISGIFSFKTYRQLDGAQDIFTSGVFYKIPYIEL